MQAPRTVTGWLLTRLLNAWRFGEAVDARVRAQLAHARFSSPAGVPLAPVPPQWRAVATDEPRPPMGSGAIFITARFRTGSTFLWQLFNALPGFAAFYEPLNERHGDDRPWQASDPTHRGAGDYRQHYARVGERRALHRMDWTYRNLYMDTGDRDAALEAWIAALCAPAELTPVLQFNRVDFRLRWLRHYFPGARLLHLYRAPREQWLSTLGKSPVTAAMSVAEFAAHDHFYLLPWARDLARVYPFLLPERHRSPYALHYLIWRLSFAHGQHYADYSFSFEQLVADVPGVMRDALAACGRHLPAAALDALRAVSDPPALERWPGFASADWFGAIEADCDRQLEAAFGPCRG